MKKMWLYFVVFVGDMTDLTAIFNWIWDNLPFRQFVNPEKRIYWPYLVLCLFYALLFILFSKDKLKHIRFRNWVSPSARIDYSIWIVNYFLQISVLPLVFASALFFAGRFYYLLTDAFGPCTLKIFMSNWGIVWYSLTFMLLSDFSRYGLHYLLHHNRFLSHIHKMHHSAEVLTPITLYRSHPLEMVLGHVRYLLVYSLTTGLFLYLYNDFFDFPKILGVSFFVFISNILGANLRHSGIPIGFGWLERVMISPKQHQMHHSTDLSMQNSNLGSFLSIWDLLFSTWKPSKGVGEIQYGVAEQSRQSLRDELTYPFVKWWKSISAVRKS